MLRAVPRHHNVTDLPREQPPAEDAEAWFDSLLLFAALQRPSAIVLKAIDQVIQPLIDPASSVSGGHIRPLRYHQFAQLGRLLEERLDTRHFVHLRDRAGIDHGSFDHVFGNLVLTIHVRHPAVTGGSRDPFPPLQFDFTYQSPEAA